MDRANRFMVYASLVCDLLIQEFGRARREHTEYIPKLTGMHGPAQECRFIQHAPVAISGLY
jgi:hypothetical protein